MKRVLAHLLLLLVIPAVPAAAADWRADPAASRLEFAASFEGAAAPGVFRTFSVRMKFEVDKLADGSIEVTIAVNSADMNSPEVNKAIAGSEWFDFARFPQAEFRATDIRRTQAGRYVARGILRLKGVQQAIELPFSWSESPGRARLEGELLLKRAKFGIGTGEWASTSVIGADVKVKFNVALRRDG